MEIVFLTVINILTRLLPHLPNATSVGASAVFAGAKFGLRKSWIVILTTMLFTDLVKGLHPVMWATYGSLLVSSVIGTYIAKKGSVPRIFAAVSMSSAIFFLLTNFAVWLLPNTMYAKTWEGLLRCYVMALPFYRNTLIGDFFFSGLFFCAYGLYAQRRRTVALS